MTKKATKKPAAKKAKKKPVAFSFTGTVGNSHRGDSIQTYGTDFPLDGSPVAVPQDKVDMFRRRTDFKEIN